MAILRYCLPIFIGQLHQRQKRTKRNADTRTNGNRKALLE